MVTRIIYATLSMVCCRDGQQAYNPYPRQVIATQTKKYFEESINSWKSRARQALYNKYSQIAENECATMGTLILCSFNLVIDDAFETKTHVTEKGIRERIETRPTEQRKIKTIKPFKKSQTTSTPNFIYQQLEVIKDRMTEADSIDEFLALKNEMDKLKRRYTL